MRATGRPGRAERSDWRPSRRSALERPRCRSPPLLRAVAARPGSSSTPSRSSTEAEKSLVSMQQSCIVRIFQTLNQKSIKHPSIECRALSKSRIYCFEYHYFVWFKSISSKCSTTTFIHYFLKFWGYGAFLQYALYWQRNYEYNTSFCSILTADSVSAKTCSLCSMLFSFLQ